MRAGLIPYPPARVVPINGARAGFAARARQRYQGAATLPGVVGSFSHVELRNPAGSTVVVLVHYLFATVATLAEVAPARYDVALATLVNRGLAIQARVARSVAEVRREANATALGITAGTWQIAAGARHPVMNEANAVLWPNEGIGFRTDLANITLSIYAEWSEEPWVEPMPGIERP